MITHYSSVPDDETVQVVIDKAILDLILADRPWIEPFPIPHDEDDLPTFGLRAKHGPPR